MYVFVVQLRCKLEGFLTELEGFFQRALALYVSKSQKKNGTVNCENQGANTLIKVNRTRETT